MAVLDEKDNNEAELATMDTAAPAAGKEGGFSEGSREAGYIIEFDRDGVFITVYPMEDDSVLFEMDNMQKLLDKYRAVDYSIVTLSKAIRKAEGTRIQLAEIFEGDPEAEGEGMRHFGNVAFDSGLPPAEYHFDISKDRMTATIKWDAVQGRQIPPVRAVVESMHRAGIVYGIDEDHLKVTLPKGIDFIVAKGTEAVKGQDARIEKYFDLSNKGKAMSDDHDRVDFKNLQLFVLAKAGDVIARRIPHTLGTPGKNVLGDEISAKSGKPRPVPSGKNTKIENENEVVAAIDGQIVDNGSLISIDPRFEVSGNVGVSTGNIEFNGFVRVSGDVEMGFSVKATGDVEIGGVVAGGNVEGNNISITGGVQGMSRSKVIARGNLSASFVENAELEAGGEIHILDVSLHSTLTAGKKIIVEGKRGAITGGLASAGEEVKAQIIGNAANVITRISVGQNPMIHREYKKLMAELNEAKKKMDSLKKTLKALEKIDIMSLPEQRIEQINKLTRSQFPLAGEIERKTKQLMEMDEEIVKMKNGKVKVRDTIYPGVRLSINSVLKNFQTAQSCCSLYTEDDDIKTGPY
ncbi:MAG: FapA family protein [Selenomonadaceae bacterium]|nr:FapA family protein [Selenomonadaceae bacterium]